MYYSSYALLTFLDKLVKGNSIMTVAVSSSTFPSLNAVKYCRKIKSGKYKAECNHVKLLTIKFVCDSWKIQCYKYSNINARTLVLIRLI